ncbi:hypothetical protein ACP4OV_008946 [Aristida adscensionis]
MAATSSDGAASPARSAAASSVVGGGGSGQLSCRAHSQRSRLSPSLYPAPSPWPRLAPGGGEVAVSPFVSCQHQQQVPSSPAPALHASCGVVSSSYPLLHGPAMSPLGVVGFARVAAAAEQNAPWSGASAGLPLPPLWQPSRGDGNFAEPAPPSAHAELAPLPPGLSISPASFAELKQPAPAATLLAHPSPTTAPDLPPHPALGFAQFATPGRDAASSFRSPRPGSCLPPLWRPSRSDGGNFQLAQSPSSSTAGDLFAGFMQPAAAYDLPPLPPSLRITAAPAAGYDLPPLPPILPRQPRDNNGFIQFDQSPFAASEQLQQPLPQPSETFAVPPPSSSDDVPPWSVNSMGGFAQMPSSSELVLPPAANQQPIGIDAGVAGPSHEGESISLDDDDDWDFDIDAALRSFEGLEDMLMLDVDVDGDASSSGPHVGGGGHGPNTPPTQAGSSSVQSLDAGPTVHQRPAEASNMASYAVGGGSSGGGGGDMPSSSSMTFNNNSKLTIGGKKSRVGKRRRRPTFTFTNDEMAVIMKDECLKELLKTDPRRVKASLTTRQYAKKAYMRKQKQRFDLEDKIITLQMECCTLRAQLESLQEGCTELIDEKKRLGIMVQEMEKLMQLKDGSV